MVAGEWDLGRFAFGVEAGAGCAGLGERGARVEGKEWEKGKRKG